MLWITLCMALWGMRSTPWKTGASGKMAKMCPREDPFGSMPCAWNKTAGPGEAAFSRGKTVADAAVHNRFGPGLTGRGFEACPDASASTRAKLSTRPVDKRVDEGVRGAFHAPVFVGFGKDGEIMTSLDINEIIDLRVKPVRAHEMPA